jgi:two-component system C4-dicarboxylate transport sensor histidine kinase DctB
LIREKSEAYQKLAMADKAAGIGILSTGLNHHLRNSLTVLKTFHEMLPYQMQAELQGPPHDASFWSDYYQEVGAQMDRMTGMLTNLAEGVDAGSFDLHETIEIVDLVENSARFVFDGDDRIAFEVKNCGAVPTIHGSNDKVGQMMRLLFQEANSLLPNGGKVEVKVALNESQDGIVLTIFNDGELIPEADLPHLFDPFYVRSRTPEELGTNMLACYMTTFHHGGSIRAFHSGDGRNAIEVRLPVDPPAASLMEGVAGLCRLYESPGHVAKAYETALPG